MRGASRSSRNVGPGLRWTLWRQVCLRAGRKRRGVRPSRVVLAPRCWRQALRSKFSGVTVTTKPAHRGDHEVSRKTIAQGMSECFRFTCMLVCAFLCAIFGTRDRGCSAHPAFPAPSFSREGQRICKPRANASRERERIPSPHVVPAKAGTHTPRRKLLENCGLRLCFNNC